MKKAEIHIISGPINSGKSGELKKRIEKYRRRGLDVDGILTEAQIEDGKKTAYRLRRAKDGETVLLAERNSRTGGRRLTPGFHFHDSAFRKAAEWLEKAGKEEAEVICIDELGPVEAKGAGHFPALEHLLDSFAGTIELVVREELCEHFTSEFRKRGHTVVTVVTSEPEK